MIWEHPDCQLAIFQFLLPALAGATSIGKQVVGSRRADKDRALRAEQIRLSPYTGRQEFQEVNEPNAFENIAGGIQSGLLTAQGMGAFKAKPPVDDTSFNPDVKDGITQEGMWRTPQTFAATNPATTVGGSPRASGFASLMNYAPGSSNPGPYAPRWDRMRRYEQA